MINHVESINTQKEKDAVLSSMTEGVLVIDNNKKILMINEPGISYLNIESDNPTGCFVDDTIKDENFQIFINTLIKTKTPQKKEIRIKKNMKRFFLVNGTILQGEKMGALIVFSDITKLKQLEKIRQDEYLKQAEENAYMTPEEQRKQLSELAGGLFKNVKDV